MKTKFGKLSPKLYYYFLVFFQLIVILIFVNYSFEVNDDAAMRSILSGSYTGEPSAFVIFVNIILASFIKSLYVLNGYFDWYNIVLIGYASIAFIFINHINFVKHNKNIASLVIVNAVSFLLLVSLLSSMNFSKFAAFGIVSGLLPILFFKTNNLQKFGSVFLMLVGYMIRSDVFVFTLIFMFPTIFLFYKYLDKKGLYAFVFVVVSCFALNFSHKYLYRLNDDWSNSLKYNEIRSKMTSADNNRINFWDGKKYLAEVNWTENDFYLISRFMWDKGVEQMELEKLEFMIKKLNVFAFQSPSSMYIKLKTLLKYLLHFFFNSGFYLIIALHMIIMRNNKMSYLYYISSMLYVIAVLYLFDLFSYNNIYKDRIFWSAFLPVLMSSTLLGFGNVHFTFQTNRWLYLSVLLLCIFGFASKFNKDVFNFNKNSSMSTTDELNLIFDKPYISWVGIDSGNVFNNSINYSKAIFMGWFSGTPHNLRKIHELCDCNDANGIYDIKNTEVNWVFYKADVKRMERVKIFYNEKHKTKRFYTSNILLNNGVELTRLSVYVSDDN